MKYDKNCAGCEYWTESKGPVYQPDEPLKYDGLFLLIGCGLVVGVFLLAMWGLSWVFG